MSSVRFRESSYLVVDGKKHDLKPIWSTRVGVAIDSRLIIKLLDAKVMRAEFVHTHPGSSSSPSQKDLRYKKIFKRICDRKKIESEFYIKCKGGLYEY